MSCYKPSVFLTEQAEVSAAAVVLRSIAADSAAGFREENNNIVAVPAKQPMAA